MPKLDEQALRRPDFLGGIPVMLADGQEWTLPRPVVRTVPADTEVGFMLKVGGDLDGYQALFEEAQAADAGSKVMKTELALARYLLCRNYDLTTEQVQDLIQFSYKPEIDPIGAALREAVMAVAMGDAPKTEAATDE